MFSNYQLHTSILASEWIVLLLNQKNVLKWKAQICIQVVYIDNCVKGANIFKENTEGIYKIK